MISFEERFGKATIPVTPEHWEAIITSSTFAQTIQKIRRLRGEGKSKEADQEKRRLPAVCYQGTFMETESKSGNLGAWRKQSAIRLNGLFMLDIDHMENEEFRMKSEEFASADFKQKAKELGIVLVHVTSSGQGLRIVAKADPEVGNIADNQHALAARLNVICDEACKNADRLSFVPTWDDILYSDFKTLLSYENETFDQKYGEMYRGGRSAATRNDNNNRAFPAGTGSKDGIQGDAQGDAGGAAPDGLGNGNTAGDAIRLEYRGVSYGRIIEAWMDTYASWWRKGVGEQDKPLDVSRHRLLLSMASDLRYVCGKKDIFTTLVKESPLGQVISQERGEQEVLDIADDSLRYRIRRDIPKRFAAVLESAGVREPEGDDAGRRSQPGIDYESWWRRLQPLLDESPYLREACSLLPPHHRIGGVLASGAMFGTYLSRCWWEHYDGKPMRLSFLVYIIGDAASGKSVIGDIDKLVMAPMKAADKAGREWERQYKEEMKKRAASSKNAKEAAPEQLHPVIRYVPSTISNSQLYTRLTDALDKECLDAWGEPLHLHLYTYEAELATALRAQSGGAWAAKLDLECKSFQNEEAGVDYKNEGSPNGVIQVNWNQVVTGTPDAMRRKIRKSTVLDGLVTRLCLFPMPPNRFAMIPRGRRLIQHERDCMLRAVGLELEKISGELSCERLVDFAYDYEQQLCNEAEEANDDTMDYFRKRVPLIMIRYALVRAVLRQVKELVKGEDLQIEDSDLEFARLIGDWCYEMQLWMFGNDVYEARQLSEASKEPKRRWNKSKGLFEKLPQEFTLRELEELTPDMSKTGRSNKLSRWIADGVLEKKENRYIKKTNSLE